MACRGFEPAERGAQGGAAFRLPDGGLGGDLVELAAGPMRAVPHRPVLGAARPFQVSRRRFSGRVRSLVVSLPFRGLA